MHVPYHLVKYFLYKYLDAALTFLAFHALYNLLYTETIFVTFSFSIIKLHKKYIL